MARLTAALGWTTGRPVLNSEASEIKDPSFVDPFQSARQRDAGCPASLASAAVVERP